MTDKKLLNEIQELPFDSEEIRAAFVALSETKKVIIDENPHQHVCVYTLPYHHETKQVLLGHHIKANKWLVPGGHVDAFETIVKTAIREIKEELAIGITTSEISPPFFVDVTKITSKPPRFCTVHYSIWVYFSCPSNMIVLDRSEFYDSKWVSLSEAITKTSDQANKDALSKFSQLIGM